MTSDQVITEARARIIWGEPSSSVRGFLVSNGISDTVADTKIKEFVLERQTEIRRLGIKYILSGVIVTAASCGVLLWLLFAPGSFNAVRWLGASVSILACIGLYGIWKLLRGVIYLARPQTEHKSISDVAE